MFAYVSFSNLSNLKETLQIKSLRVQITILEQTVLMKKCLHYTYASINFDYYKSILKVIMFVLDRIITLYEC